MLPREPLPASDPVAELRVPAGRAGGAYRDRGSRFLALAAPASCMEEARAVLSERRARFHDATHHVHAARFMDETRAHDDGEPSGTGGRPVLRAIERAGLYRLIVVVTRYFGGTKLGTGGLARAYGAAASAALEELPTLRALPGRELSVRYGYADTGAVMRALDRVGVERLEEGHGDRAQLRLLVPERALESVVRSLQESTAGRATCDVAEERSLIVLPSADRR